MPDIEKIKTGIFEMLQRNTWKDIDNERRRFQPVLNDALKLLKEQQAEIERLKQEKTDAIERIKRMAEEIPYTPAKTETNGIYLSGKYWGMKDALDILKGKDGAQE